MNGKASEKTTTKTQLTHHQQNTTTQPAKHNQQKTPPSDNTTAMYQQKAPENLDGSPSCYACHTKPYATQNTRRPAAAPGRSPGLCAAMTMIIMSWWQWYWWEWEWGGWGWEEAKITHVKITYVNTKIPQNDVGKFPSNNKLLCTALVNLNRSEHFGLSAALSHKKTMRRKNGCYPLVTGQP